MDDRAGDRADDGAHDGAHDRTTRDRPDDRADEPKQEFRERFRELLEELRVILPGIQVLFAFLLTTPFSSRFPELDRYGRIGFAITLGAAGVATLVLIAPTVYHRIDRRNDRAERVRASIIYLFTGAVLSGVAICSGTFVVARFVYGPPAGIWSSSALAAMLLVSWFIVPLVRRR